jgi:hypothetical protein
MMPSPEGERWEEENGWVRSLGGCGAVGVGDAFGSFVPVLPW